MGKCVFNRKWLTNPNYRWVKEFKGDEHKLAGHCCIYNKVIDIECMGQSALKSHVKGDKHKRNTCTTLSLTQSALIGTFCAKKSVQVVI